MIELNPIVVARKPLSEGTVMDNVQKWRTGGLNIDESRIETDEELGRDFTKGKSDIFGGGSGIPGSVTTGNPHGRFPANLIIDEEAGRVLDEQSGISKSTGGRIEKKTGWGEFGGSGNKEIIEGNPGFGDIGGASRFFKTIKNDKSIDEDINMDNVKLLLGDCLDELKGLDDNSVDSIVTDPPYGLSFMGKQWDYDVPSVEIWEECLRVLKPGGHLLAFAGSRTYHRMAVRIEDAGFEIRDMISWLYGSGFPKSMDISKQFDKRAGAEREVVGDVKFKGGNQFGLINDDGWEPKDVYNTAPATDLAKEWSGWGTALKPAHEPVVMARKPLSEGTVMDNVQKWRTGGINIDESRISTDDNLGGGATKGSVLSVDGFDRPWMHNEEKMKEFSDKMKEKVEHAQTLGRFPANIIFDEEAGKLLDEQSGISKSVGGRSGDKEGVAMGGIYGDYKGIVTDKNPGFGDVGGASRFFYCPKVSKSERNEGLTIRNPHPTLKPVDLMLYLIRLVTPKGGTTLDPFMGSGSTGKAAVRGGFGFIGIEREGEYYEIAEARINYEADKPKVVKTTTGKKVEVSKETEQTLNTFFE